MGEYDEQLNNYLAVTMAQALLYWNASNYKQVEKMLKTSCEFGSENEAWNVNMAHTLFMQEKY